MGCGESKIKKISLTSEADWDMDKDPVKGEVVKDSVAEKWRTASRNSGDLGEDLTMGSGSLKDKELTMGSGSLKDRAFSNRLLSAIPTSDLGESLDCRPTRWQEGSRPDSDMLMSHSAPVSAHSLDSGDSGYDEYEGDYSHIITEHSDQVVVDKIVSEFKTVELPELLVITGRACTRLLSGYQKNKNEEASILATLREEGLLAKPGEKSTGGLSFEIVDANDQDLSASFNKAAQFIPNKKLMRLEQRREHVRKQEMSIQEKMAEAEERRKAMEEEKRKKLNELCGHERLEKARDDLIAKKDEKQLASMEKRKQQLQVMRDKLKDKNKKIEMVRLKKTLALEDSHGEGDLLSKSFFDD